MTSYKKYGILVIQKSLKDEISLTESIAKIVGPFENLSTCEINNIVEEVNTAMYLHLVKNNSNYVEFEVADAAKIGKKLEKKRADIITKYASFAEEVLIENGDQYSEEDVVKLASAMIDHDLEIEEEKK
jgi:hypothetical protein